MFSDQQVVWVVCGIVSSVFWATLGGALGAKYRGDVLAGIVLGLLCGPLGLLVLLVVPDNRPKCPACRSVVDPLATVCPACRRELDDKERRYPSRYRKSEDPVPPRIGARFRMNDDTVVTVIASKNVDGEC